MSVYKLKAKRKYGDMPGGYEFQVVSATMPDPDKKDIKKEIQRLGFNSDAQSYSSSGNFEVKKG